MQYQKLSLSASNSQKEITLLLDKKDQAKGLFISFIGHKKERFQLNTIIQHLVAETQARVIVKGVLYDQSSAIVEGIIKIDSKAQQTDSFLEQKILLIGEKSWATAEPKLEIKANQVKASHAATVGRLDLSQVFYLQSRGLSYNQAVEMLVAGFLNPKLS